MPPVPGNGLQQERGLSTGFSGFHGLSGVEAHYGPFANFGGTDGHDVMGIAFAASGAPTKFSFQIDEVAFY